MLNKFAQATEKYLTNYITGSPKITVVEDKLIIDIFTYSQTLSYHNTVSNVSDKICRGMTPQTLAYQIADSYLTYLVKKFFKVKIYCNSTLDVIES